MYALLTAAGGVFSFSAWAFGSALILVVQGGLYVQWSRYDLFTYKIVIFVFLMKCSFGKYIVLISYFILTNVFIKSRHGLDEKFLLPSKRDRSRTRPPQSVGSGSCQSIWISSAGFI